MKEDKIKRYRTLKPKYVMELVYDVGEEVILRRESEVPWKEHWMPKDSREEDTEQGHIFEFVLVKQTEYEYHKERKIRDQQPTWRGIRILSSRLKRVLYDAVRHYYDDDIFARWFIKEPYMAIFHYKEQLGSIEDTPDNKRTVAEIDALLDFVHGQIGMKPELERLREDQPRITFRNYWMLFPLGSKVCWRKDGMDSMWVVNSIEGGIEGRSDKG